jgi:magnesium transporter
MSEEAQLTDTEDLQERLAECRPCSPGTSWSRNWCTVRKGRATTSSRTLCTSSTCTNCRASWSRCTRPTSPTSRSAADRRTLIAWELVNPELEGEILLEVSDAVRESLIESMERTELVAAAETLDADELADLAPDLPQGVIDDVFRGLSVEEREQLRAAMSYPEDSVGSIMDFEMVTVREDVTLEVVLRYLRRFDELPDHTDQLFVVDREST